MASSLEQLERTRDVQVVWRAYELRPAGAPPMPPEYQARIEAARPRLVAMAKNQYGLDIVAPKMGVNSRLALVGAKCAENMGRGKAYHDRVFRAYWQEGRHIGDVEVLVALAVEVGIDPAAFRLALSDPAFDAAVQADVDLAYAYGLQGVPALVFNDKYLVSGAQPIDALQRAVDVIAAER